ncbi:MAG: adenine deaminase [Phycisphaeraceae bacterium]|nr:adenine deaminase [Phycisphaeraceae bacterium]
MSSASTSLPAGPITPELLAVARGDAPTDLLLSNAKVINVFNRSIESASVAIHRDRIAGVGDYAAGKEVIDLKGAFVAPGFIDAHMHVESTSLPPSQFVRLALPHGTTGVVLDPHEIANVLGIPGIRYIMDDAADLPINAMFALSSCVPSSHLETSGARLEASDLAPLFDDPRVVALAEMMNFPGVVHADPNVLAKINLGLDRRIVDGHSPGLKGKPLQAYIAAGISSDHECTTAAEALEKLSRGMRIYIREGSAARNLEALLPAVKPETLARFCFCTDDRHPGDLADEGHIDHIVRKAIALGLDPIAAITIATLNPAMHYRRRDLGAIAPGYFADLIVFDDLREPRPRQTYFHGRLTARDGVFVDAAMPPSPRPKPPVSPLRLPALSEDSFAIPAKSGTQQIRVIGMDPHQLLTTNLIMPPKVIDGKYVADVSRDLLKLCVVERHRASGNIGRGFITGFGLKEGAIASTVGHDSHNLAVLGTNDADMLAAARALEACGGGQCAVRNGKVLALFPLPIAGLMSDQPATIVIQQQRALMAAAQSLGCPHHDPFMPLSFMPLPVIPSLKLSDLGLVDVDQFRVVPLEVPL